MGVDGLLEMKRISGRNKDLIDIDELTKGESDDWQGTPRSRQQDEGKARSR